MGSQGREQSGAIPSERKWDIHLRRHSFRLFLIYKEKNIIISVQSANWSGCYKCSGCYQPLIDLSLPCGYLVLHSHIFSLLTSSLESSLDLLPRDNWLCPHHNPGLHRTNLLHQLDAVLDILLIYYPLNTKGFGKWMTEVHSWGLSLKAVSDASSRSWL